MNWAFENDTSSIVKKMARKYLKASNTRSILTVLTVMLSVSLLSGFVLSVIGMETAEAKDLQVANHVLYGNVDNTQLRQLEGDARISDTLFIKQAPNTRIENYFVIPVYIAQNKSNIATEPIVSGHYPEQLYEAAVDRAYLKRLGLPDTLGTQITITFYDGITETFTVVGLTDSGVTERAYSLYCSKEYAENGSQLKDAVSALAVQLKDTSSMSKETFEETALQIGNDYGISHKNSDINEGYASSLSPTGQETMMIILVSLVVMLASYLVVYGIFYIYVQNQVREFGQLRTIGATAKQIKKIIRLQGNKLCLTGTVIGLPIGYTVAYLFKPNGWNWGNTVIASILVFLFSYFIVQLSLQKPAKIAGTTSPMEATKSTGYQTTDRMFSKKLHRRITPLSLAVISSTRNRKKLFIAVLSLGIAGILFMAGTTLLSSLDRERFARHGLLEYGEFEIDLSRKAERLNPHGQTGLQVNNPLDSSFIQTVLGIDGIKEVTALQTLAVQYEYGDTQEKSRLTPFAAEQQALLQQYVVNGTVDYENMCTNREILLLRNEYSQIVHGWKFQVGDIIHFKWYNGSEYQEAQFKIAGEIEDAVFRNPAGGKMFGKAQYFLLPDVLLAQMMPSGFNFNSNLIISLTDTAAEPEIRMQLNDLVSATPLVTMETLHDYYLDSNVMYQRTSAVIWGISIFAMLFAVINLINTLTANILSRKHEFSLLRSVGMESRQLRRTIQYEGIILAFWNVLLTSCLGGAAGFGIVRYLNYVGDNTWVWTFPIRYMIGYTVVAVLLPILISSVIIGILQKKTLVEQLRDIS